MDNLSKEEKNALKIEWKASQNKEYILTQEIAQKLFEYLEEQLNNTGCDHTLRHTKQWLKDNISKELFESVIEEITNKFAGEGRVLIRPSGTEPLVRVMIEGKDQKVIEEEARKLANLIMEVML